MTKRVQLVRHDNAGSQTFLGKDGEITVNTGNKSIHVHDAVNAGGTELARADVTNVSAATAGNAGKMSAQQASELAQALLDIVQNTTDITSNDVDIAANLVSIGNLETSRANKIVPTAAGNLASLDAAGDLTDSGKAASTLVNLVGGNVNFMLFYQAAAPTGWTKLLTQNDKSLRVVSGVGGGSGGTKPFTTTFGAGKTSDSYTLLEVDVPAHDHGSVANHSHSLPDYTGGGIQAGIQGITLGLTSTANVTGAAGGHTHTSFGGDGGHTHALSNFDLQYLDVIICSKD